MKTDKYKNVKVRSYVLVSYPDELENKNMTTADLVQYLEKRGANVVGINHYADTNEDGEQKKLHTHLVLEFSSQRYYNSVLDDLDEFSFKQFLEPCKNLKAACRYLVHADHLDKYQYPTDDIFGTESLKAKCIKWCTEKPEVSNEEALESIINFVQTYYFMEKLTLQTLFAFCISHNYLKAYKLYYQIIKDIVNERNNRINETAMECDEYFDISIDKDPKKDLTLKLN